MERTLIGSLSQHIGDLETVQAYSAFQRVIADFQKFYAVTPWLVIGADVQFIRPGLDHDTAIFTGLRTVIKF